MLNWQKILINSQMVAVCISLIPDRRLFDSGIKGFDILKYSKTMMNLLYISNI